MIVLSYLWLLALAPLLMAREDAEVQWHARHGVLLLVVELLLGIGSTVLGAALAAVPSSPYWLVGLLTPFVALGVLVLHVLCIVAGLKGQRLVIPGISQYADRLGSGR
jgi:uncharacterized membrane protein